MTFVRPSLSELIERNRGDFETRLPGADSRLRHSVLDVLARMHGGAAAGLYGYLDFNARQLMPDTAEAEYLARWASIWGVRRKAATPATASAGATGVNGSTIPAGTELQRADGARYLTTAVATIAAGTAALAIEAAEAGALGDILAGTVLTFTSPVAGVSAQATISAQLIAGSDEEDDASLLARLLSRIQQPPQGGTANDYVTWALAQPGVTRAWAYGQWMGLGTVGLTFVMDGRVNILPLAGDLTAMEAAIDLLRPVTAEVFVFAPVAQSVDFVIRAIPDTPAVRAAIVGELGDFFAREAQPGGTLYRSRMGEAISLAGGEFRHVIELPDRDVVSGPGKLLVLGTVSFVA